MKTAQLIKRHILVHTGEKPFVCNQCGKSYNQKINLNRHIVLRHTNERPFSCNHCDKTFKLKHHLEQHASVHKGED